MATLRTRWLLSILLVNLSDGFAAAGPLPSPPPPECVIPCSDKECGDDIYCSWHPWQDQIPTNYSLHWGPTNTEKGQVISTTSLSGIIHRQHFSLHDDLRVWVQHGSVKSQEAKFSTADIRKPPPPEVREIHPETLEIEWKLHCEQLVLSVGSCDVRHRIQASKDWIEVNIGSSDRYTVDSLKHCPVFEFQARCSCYETLKSDWSAVDRVQQEKAPVGELDVWRDCRISPPTFDCVLTWKKLPTSQACGLILGYEVGLFDSNGAVKLAVNRSTAETRGLSVCDEMQCYFNSSLKNASSVSVSAYNAHGSTAPSYLTVPRQVSEKIDQAIKLNMTEDHLTVSWDLPSQPSNSDGEYVVEYKQVGLPPGQGFDWVKVPKNQTQASFKGIFKKYTAYQVSLMRLHSNEVHHLSSAIGYSLHGIPPKVPFFELSDIAADRVVLFWMPVPLSKKNGLILYYQIDLNSQNVCNVSAFPYHKNKTLELQDLKPGQKHSVTIRAVTAAGPGENVTTSFDTKDRDNFARFILPLCVVGLLVVICISAVLYSAVCRSETKACVSVPQCLYEKVPDPGNSHIFTQMKPQINEPFSWICFPVCEPQPNISLLEVVERREKDSDSEGPNKPVVRGGCTQVDSQDDQREDTVTECHRTEHRYGRQAYSKMIDSDEERDKEEEMGSDGWNSSEEEPCKSGYEKHFMPTSLEILEVS